MAKGVDSFFWEDDACLNCGDVDFYESKTPGICIECYVEAKQREEGHQANPDDPLRSI